MNYILKHKRGIYMSVIVLTPVKERHKELLRKTFTNEEFVFETNNTVTEEQFKNAEIVFGQPSSDKIKKYENIKWVQLPSAGYDPYIGKGIRKDLYFSSISMEIIK